MSNPASSELPTRIRAQLAETERRIADLIAVRDGLLRVYVRVSSQDKEDRHAWVNSQNKEDRNEIRSNSYDRLLIESAILEVLAAAEGRPIPTRKLFIHAHIASPKLKYSTFRSYLTRLKERGLVAAEARARGFWKVSDAALWHLPPAR